jgi:hypothetical protein
MAIVAQIKLDPTVSALTDRLLRSIRATCGTSAIESPCVSVIGGLISVPAPRNAANPVAPIMARTSHAGINRLTSPRALNETIRAIAAL